MKRVLSLILCLLMFCSTVALFSSCKKPEEDLQVSDKAVEVDLKGYAVVRPSDFTSVTLDKVTSLTSALKKQTGIEFKAQSDTKTAVVETEDLEILIGDVNRTETQEALQEIEGHGFAIRVSKFKIVIVGTTNLLTGMALDYFVQNYATDAAINETTITINKEVTQNNIPMLVLGEDGKTDYAVIYRDGLDADNSCEHGGEAASCTESRLDYPVTVANSAADVLRRAISGRTNSVKCWSDANETRATEIIVGNAGRAEGLVQLSYLSETQYGVLIKDGKIYIQAWYDSMLKYAGTLFKNIINDSIITTKDARGNTYKCVVVPADYSSGNSRRNPWATEFPKPQGENVIHSGMVDVGDGAMEYYYTGSGVNATLFDTYCQTLKDNGYTVAVPENTIEGSKFCTFENATEGITLYVAYNHYANDAEGNYEKCLRVVSSHMKDVTLPGNLLPVQTNTYNRVTDSMVTSVSFLYVTAANGGFGDNGGMSYIITLEDGSFVVMDGGKRKSASKDEDEMYRVLVALHTQIYGEEPSATNPIRIAAWIMTHEHNDHIDTFTDFCKKYGKTPELKIQNLVANFASEDEIYRAHGFAHSASDSFEGLQSYMYPKFNYIKVHTGQKFYIANMEIEILATHEDFYPLTIDYFNDTSIVFRITLNHTNDQGETVAQNTSLWTGDMYKLGSRFVTAMYGNYLQSDMVQVSHHGYNGAEKEFYQYANATCALVPTWWQHWYVYHGDNPNYWFWEVNQAVRDMENLEYTFVLDYTTKNPNDFTGKFEGLDMVGGQQINNYHITLKMTDAGMDYENPFNAVTGEDIIFDEITAIRNTPAAE